MHIVIASTTHPIDDVRVNSKFVRSFLEKGHRVTWVGPDLCLYLPEFREPGVTYELFARPSSRIDRFRAPLRLRRRLRHVRDADWIYAPTPDAAAVAIRAARKSGARVLFDLLEVYHGALLDRYVRHRRAQLVRTLVRRRIAKVCRDATLVSVVSASVRDHYQTDNDASFVIVRSCAPSWFVHPDAASRQLRSAGMHMRFMHGKSLDNNGAPAIIAAQALVDPDIRLTVVMFRMPGLADSAAASQVRLELSRLSHQSRVLLLDPVAHDEMPRLMASCDVGLISYGRGLGEDSLPNRLFEYMASGLAIVAPEYSREISRIIQTEDIGRVFDPESPESVAATMTWLAQHPDEVRAMGLRAREAFLLRHNWEHEFQTILTRMEAIK